MKKLVVRLSILNTCKTIICVASTSGMKKNKCFKHPREWCIPSPGQWLPLKNVKNSQRGAERRSFIQVNSLQTMETQLKVPSTETRGRSSFIKKVFAQIPKFGPFYTNEVFKMHISDWSELCCLIVWYHVLWWVGKKKANEDVMVEFWLDEPGLSPLITRDQELPYNSWLKQREQ